ncbi:hypothetical protein [Vibrio sp. Vb0587]|uniref:hypothetical protein n=1 Tax=Vibrio sp. Vb0587 TaxID=3074626 RepID=UPI002963EDC5|nr:hypothetical protein [Vibrio sp. Vb0587]MDW1965758.1 hypothetical protein [Vibrio sp. Vb0587]
MKELNKINGNGKFYSVDGDVNCKIRVNNVIEVQKNTIKCKYKNDTILINKLSNSKLMLLDVSLFSTNATPVNVSDVLYHLSLFEDNKFRYDRTDDSHICLWSDFAEDFGLDSFYSGDINPKIIKTGCIAFELPITHDELYISLDVLQNQLTEIEHNRFMAAMSNESHGVTWWLKNCQMIPIAKEDDYESSWVNSWGNTCFKYKFHQMKPMKQWQFSKDLLKALDELDAYYYSED